MIRRAALAVLASFGLAACGGGDDDAGPASPEISVTTASTPSPTASTTAGRPLVSLATSCQLLFPESGAKGALDQMMSVVVEDTIGQKELNAAKGGLDVAADVAQTAQPELADQLQVLIDETSGIVADLENFGTTQTQTSAIKAAGIEVTNICIGVL